MISHFSDAVYLMRCLPVSVVMLFEQAVLRLEIGDNLLQRGHFVVQVLHFVRFGDPRCVTGESACAGSRNSLDQP